MVSSARDLARWASSLYTGHVVPQPELDQMLVFQECYDNYGLGTRKLIINGRVAYGHLGSLRGYTDAMWYFPEEGATLVLLSNLGGSWNLGGAVRKLQEVLFEGIGAPPSALDPNLNTRNHDGVTLRC
jgi:CubicO group peptidase (beta-lactamase class C family)